MRGGKGGGENGRVLLSASVTSTELSAEPLMSSRPSIEKLTPRQEVVNAFTDRLGLLAAERVASSPLILKACSLPVISPTAMRPASTG